MSFANAARLACCWLVIANCLVVSLQSDGVLDQSPSLARLDGGSPQEDAIPGSKKHRNFAPEANPSAWDRGFVACVSAPGRETSVPDAVRAVAALKSLRRAGNHDMLMVFHVDGELPDKEILLLKQYKGVMVRDLRDVWDRHDLDAVGNETNRFRSFDCKIMALLHSPFKKTMLIDSDTLFFEDPARLFTNQLMKDTGTLFFYDRHAIDPNPQLMKGAEKCGSIVNFAHWASTQADMMVRVPVDFRQAHASFCQARTSHEQDASLLAVDSDHPSAAKFLEMLKRFHTQYIMKNETVKQWSFGDKEFYWIACEFAGVHCGFNPRGRPMHLFFESSFTGVKKIVRSQGDDDERPGCSVQVSLAGDGSKLLYANLSDKYCSWDTLLNAVTVWNPKNTTPQFHEGWKMRTGRGARPLSSAEQAVANAYRDDVARLKNSGQ